MTNENLIESVTTQIDSDHKRIENNLIAKLSNPEINSVEKKYTLIW